MFIYLETKHFTASYNVVDSSTENVHGVADHGRGVKKPPRRGLRVWSRNYGAPRLCVEIKPGIRSKRATQESELGRKAE